MYYHSYYQYIYIKPRQGVNIMERAKLIENMMTFFPLLHKKMVKRWPLSSISKLQFELLFSIIKHDGMPMSYYSEKMLISRPNLTGLSDKLIEEGLVERLQDPDDRRIIILKATKKRQGIYPGAP